MYDNALAVMYNNALAVGITANLISFLTGILFKTYLYTWYKRRTNPLRGLLPFGNKPHQIAVAYGIIPPNESKKIYTIEEGDTHIIQGIQEVLSQMYGKRRLHVRSYVAIEQSLEIFDNVVSMSGPKWNRITENFIGQLGSPIQFGKSFGSDGLVLLNSEMQIAHKYDSIRTADTIAKKCYGFIIAGRIKRSDGMVQNVLVCAGNSTLSTYGALLFLRNLASDKKQTKQIKKQLRKNKNRWGLVIEVTNSQSTQGYFPINSAYIQLKPVNVLRDSDFLSPYEYHYSL